MGTAPLPSNHCASESKFAGVPKGSTLQKRRYYKRRKRSESTKLSLKSPVAPTERRDPNAICVVSFRPSGSRSSCWA